MSVLSLRLPKSMYQQLKALAQEEGVSMNQFVTLAVAEKMATMNTSAYLADWSTTHQRYKPGRALGVN